MGQKRFTMPLMPQMELAVTKTILDAESPLNQNEAHIHKECEVYVNLSGNVAFAVEDRLYSVSRGSVIITMPYEYHHCIYRSNVPHEHYWITFSASSDYEFSELFFNREKGINNRIDLTEAALTELCEILERLIDGRMDGLDRRMLVLRFFRLLMDGAGVSSAGNSDQLPADVASALKYVDLHLQEELDIRTLAQACNVSINTLERHFKDSLGISPFAMIRKKKAVCVYDVSKKRKLRDGGSHEKRFFRLFQLYPNFSETVWDHPGTV